MKILIRRTQYMSGLGRAKFRLWGQIETDETETKLIDTYNLRGAVLMGALHEGLIKQCLMIGLLTFLVSGAYVGVNAAPEKGLLTGLILGLGSAYGWYHYRREIIFVRDLLHGRDFHCHSVVELVQKEAMLDSAAFVLRQVVESAKQWDGTEAVPIEALPRDEAKEVILKAFPIAL